MLSLKTESWIWYGFVMLIVCLRFLSRSIQLGGPKKLQIEDGVMVFVSITYTFLIVYLNALDTLPTNLIPPDQVKYLDPSTIPARIHGSKIVIVVEQCWCATIWGCKACLLLLYWNLTSGLRRRIVVKVVAAYALFGYVLMEVLFFAAWCRPFYNYWSVPPENMQCDTYQDHLITNTVFNISTDLMMLGIPIPILARANLPLRKKIILIGVFSLGIFVILCAILSKYYSFHLPYGAEWVYWYVREVSTAVIVANIPHCWVLLRRIFNLRSFLPHLSHHLTGRDRYGTAHTDETNQHSATPKSLSSSIGTRTWYKHMRSDSEERITGKGGAGPIPLEIWQESEWRVESDGELAAGRGAKEAKGIESVDHARGSPTDGLRLNAPQPATTTKVTTKN